MRVVTAAVTLFLVLACGGGGTEAFAPPPMEPEPAPATVEAPTEPTEPPAPPPAPDEEVEEVEEEASLTDLFTEGEVAAIEAARKDFDAIASAPDFARVMRKARDLTGSLQGSLDKAYDEEDPIYLDWAIPLFPGLDFDVVAEGAVLVLYLDIDSYRPKAKATPEPSDDAFVALMRRAHDTLDARGFAAWLVQTWDYGGCSALGDGTLLEVLQLSDAALSHGDLFEPEIREVRERAVEHITGDHSNFPYCNASTLQPTPRLELEGEVREILEKVELTEAERSKLEARLARDIVGEEFTGG
ncbi:MAG: hypothetical protein JRI25_23190 [Deltaproteobacteria bacterium]|nr:hypothetical protein [Deltaproteobacteria bacterium]